MGNEEMKLRVIVSRDVGVLYAAQAIEVDIKMLGCTEREAIYNLLKEISQESELYGGFDNLVFSIGEAPDDLQEFWECRSREQCGQDKGYPLAIIVHSRQKKEVDQ